MLYLNVLLFGLHKKTWRQELLEECNVRRFAHKPSCIMAGLPEVPSGLPTVPDNRSSAGCLPFIGSVGRGNHEEGVGCVPPALQEVLRNLDIALTSAVEVDRAIALLSGQRPGRALSLATLLDRLLLDSKGKRRHTSQSEAVIAHITGLSALSIQDVLRGVRRRGGAPCALGGKGGRPSKRKFCVVSEVVGEPEQMSPEFLELLEGICDSPCEQQKQQQQQQ